MIKVGTICYIIAPNFYAGKTCEVLSGLVNATVNLGLPLVHAYQVKLANGQTEDDHGTICIQPPHLIPISDSDLNDEINRQRIAEDHLALLSPQLIEAMKRAYFGHYINRHLRERDERI